MSRPSAVTRANDDDLEDLIASNGEHYSNHAPLNLDSLTQGKLDVSPRSKGRRQSFLSSCLRLCQAQLTYLTYAHPVFCSCTVIVGIVFGMVVLVNAIFNPTETFGVINNDYSNIQSQYDLSLGKIDHWCLKGDNDSCRCEDPLVPTSRAEYKTWVQAHHENKLLVESWRDSDMLDVAFLGESLVEEMDGRWMGKTHTDQLKDMEKMFQKHFTKEKSGINGVALGVAGDTSPNVLWRLMHGEMPEEFNPSIWWINLGMNDLGRMQCSEEVVVMGILRVVEEILTKKPSAKIVINSMLPMPDLRGGIYPHVVDYRDAFRPVKGQKGNARIPNTYYARGKTAAGAAGASAGTADNKGPQQHGTTKVKKTKPDTRFLKKKRNKIAEAHSSDEDEPNNPLTKKEKKQLRKVHKEKFHPKMDASKTQIRKFDPKKGFLKQTRLPLWTSITAINRELRKCCDKHSQVTYFDATPIFAERSEGSKYVLLNERISMRGHPTVEGFQLWEDAMLEKIKKMVEKINQEKSEQQAAAAAAVASANADTSEDPFTDDYEDGTDVTGGAAAATEPEPKEPEPEPKEPEPKESEPAVEASSGSESGSEDSV